MGFSQLKSGFVHRIKCIVDYAKASRSDIAGLFEFLSSWQHKLANLSNIYWAPWASFAWVIRSFSPFRLERRHLLLSLLSSSLCFFALSLSAESELPAFETR